MIWVKKERGEKKEVKENARVRSRRERKRRRSGSEEVLVRLDLHI